METARPSGPGAGVTLAVTIGLAISAGVLLVLPWQTARAVGAVLVPVSLVLLVAFMTAPARAKRRARRRAQRLLARRYGRRRGEVTITVVPDLSSFERAMRDVDRRTRETGDDR